MQSEPTSHPCPLCGYLVDVFDPVCPRCRGDAGYVARMEEEARRLRVRRWCLGGAKILVGVALIAVLLPPGLRMARQHLRGQPQPPIHGASGGMAAAPAAAQASPPTAPSAWDSASGAEVPLVVEARPELSGTIAEVDPEIYADHVVADLEGRGYQVHELTVQNLTLLGGGLGRHTGPGYQSDEGQFNWEAVVSDSATGLVMVLHGSAVVTWGGSPHEVVMVSVY